MGALGTAHYERGLAYFEVELSGHMVPEFSPVVSFHSFHYVATSLTSTGVGGLRDHGILTGLPRGRDVHYTGERRQ